MTEDTVWLTLAQAAERLGTKPRVVRGLVRQGRLPVLHLSGRAGDRIKASDLATLETTTRAQRKDERDE